MLNVAFKMLRQAFQKEFPHVTDVQFESIILPAMTLERKGGHETLKQGIGDYDISHHMKFVNTGCEYLIEAALSRKAGDIGGASKSLMMAFYSLGAVHGGGYLNEMRDIVLKSEADRAQAARTVQARKAAEARSEKKYGPIRSFALSQALELRPKEGWPNARKRARAVFAAVNRNFPNAMAEKKGISTVAQWLSDLSL